MSEKTKFVSPEKQELVERAIVEYEKRFGQKSLASAVALERNEEGLYPVMPKERSTSKGGLKNFQTNNGKRTCHIRRLYKNGGPLGSGRRYYKK